LTCDFWAKNEKNNYAALLNRRKLVRAEILVIREQRDPFSQGEVNETGEINKTGEINETERSEGHCGTKLRTGCRGGCGVAGAGAGCEDAISKDGAG
jgi:hypothetical protein